jgi:ComF family protein
MRFINKKSIYHYYETISTFLLDCILPQPEEIRAIEKMKLEDFVATVPRAERIEHGEALFSYKYPILRTAIIEVKYHGNRKIARLLAEAAYDTMVEYFADQALLSNFTSPILVPMPNSKKRRQERGFNQCEIICNILQSLDQNQTFSYNPRLLLKIKDVTSQTKTHNRAERLENLKNCFAVKNPELVQGKNIILFDDVITTGATMEEAKRTLRKAGARKVICFAVGH